MVIMIDRPKFYTSVRKDFGKLSQPQVIGFEAVLNKWEVSGLTDLRWLGYMFATDWHETDKTMQPIEEYGKGKGKPYGKPHPQTGKIYYGRGKVQLTWFDNYKKMSKILFGDNRLVDNPELALNMNVAVDIMFEGMTTGKSFAGDFTGKHLGNYFNKQTEDWFNARRIINGTDKAKLIEGYGRKFYKALL
jgi:putative chitinase